MGMELEGKKIVIVDVDGTVSIVGDRVKYLSEDPKNWDAFFDACDEDEPMEDIVELVKTLSYKYEIYFCTGRRERIREKTLNWLSETFSGKIPNKRLLMRKDGDFRSDDVAKPELLKEAGIKLSDVAFVLEDRNLMVKGWRKLGVRCLQVQEGDF